MKRTGLLLAIMLTIIVNLVTLSSVWFNRTGAPDAVITLTERELRVVQSEDDDSGIALRMVRRDEHAEVPWLDRAKLEKLGFGCPPDDLDYDVRQLRKIFVVLEYREEESEPPEGSRLFAIDAAKDPDELRRAYPDHARYIIAAAVASMDYTHDAPANEKVSGGIRQPLPPSIHVPKNHSAPFTSAVDQPSYRVTLRYGRRHEPWILAVE